jgi:hypothetical protein
MARLLHCRPAVEPLVSLWPYRRSVALVAVVAALGVAPRARAEGAVEGTVVALDAGDLVLDLGATRGASEGDVVELWRPLKLRHPLTGRTLTDRFRIGSLTLKQVRPALSLAAAEGATARPPAVGDVVVLRRAAPPPGASAPSSSGAAVPSVAPTSSAGAAVPSDPEAEALAHMLATVRGMPPDQRAEVYEAFARQWPGGRAASTLREEAAMLRGMARPPESPKGPDRDAIQFDAPREATAGRPIDLALRLRDEGLRAILHLRAPGEATYRSRPMESAGPGYHRARIGGEEVKSPELLYFIEAVGQDGVARSVVGNAQAPRRLAVQDPEQEVGLGSGPVTMAFWVDYANFNRLKGNDYLVQTEGYFGARLGEGRVRAVRSGFGVLRGRGGTLAELDEQGLQGRRVGLTYGYLEGELATEGSLAFLGRLVLGLRRDGVGSGGQFFLRFGSDLRTNLLLGGEFLGGVGLRGITQLEWRTIPRIPIVLRTEVTNQPAGEIGSLAQEPDLGSPRESLGKSEVGLRAIVQAGYEITPSFTLSARASYQGRTINHAGPGFGAAVSYQW